MADYLPDDDDVAPMPGSLLSPDEFDPDEPLLGWGPDGPPPADAGSYIDMYGPTENDWAALQVPEQQVALNQFQRQFVPESVATNTKSVLSNITNGTLNSSEINQIYNEVLKHIELNDALQFRNIDPSDNPLRLNAGQGAILDSEINNLSPPNLQQRVRDEFDKALANGRVVRSQSGP